MKKNLVLIWILTLIHAMYFNIAYALEFDAIVAKDGSGNYLTIQEAINAAPSNSTVPFIIFIKNGEYNEKLYFQKSFITLIGEDRDSTIIVTAELRRVWRETNPGDWGVATINIENGITDLTFANLTIKNNFAEVYPDFPDNNDHTMAIRGGGHRIILINCTVVAAGGDTVSLWNTDGGMFYHNRCYFEGYVDYVCPRGYCYISDCDFYGYNGNASIWHDGSGGKDHKLVIKKSNFDGISSFGLGRFHRMSAFYLLDCDFSNNMRNNDISYVGDSLSSDRDKLIYGRRVYYYNCHREEYDYFWHENNLEKAEGSPYPDSINALWTFNNQWNPEAKIEGLLPFAFLPSPANETRNIELQPVLTWLAGRNAISHNIYLGTTNPPEFIKNHTETTYTPETLQEGTKYYWRIDEVTDTDTIEGITWEFSSLTSSLPGTAYNPQPEDGSSVLGRVVLSWEYDELTVDTFLVYFDTISNPEFLKKSVVPGYLTDVLNSNTTYYWRVDTKNKNGITTGELWSFINDPEEPEPEAIKNYEINGFRILQYYPNPVKNGSVIRIFLPEPGMVELNLYDISGRYISSFEREFNIIGENIVEINNSIFQDKSLEKNYICVLLYKNQQEIIKLQME